ncbi:MAG: nitrite reductase [Bacillales bacterium]|nr:nitrite reductase [Bacillales bacterium]
MNTRVKFSLFAMLTIFTLILSACNNNDDENFSSKKQDTGLSVNEISNEAFKEKFPLHYESYMKNNDDTTETKYGGSVPTSKFHENKEPYLPILFNNFGFAQEYNEERGHTYANIDIKKVARITEKSPGACLTCKSTAVPRLIETMGVKYYSANFLKEVLPKAEEMGHSPVGCSDCHNPKTMELRITREPFVKAMKEVGIDVSKASKNDMRSYVCAQCHVEYYFKADTKEVTFPWDKGFKQQDMYDYYDELRKKGEFVKDFDHSISGAPILKAQHPEFENSQQGIHAKNGVSCSDCHMPYKRVDGKKMSSHNTFSPLLNDNTIEDACRTCHSDQSVKEIKDHAYEIQDTHMEGLHYAQDVSVKAHYYVNKMITSKVPEDRIKEAQEAVRKGQWFWDIVAAENSAGFHNPQGGMNSLRISTNESNKAIQLATVELVKKGVDINELNDEIRKVMKAVAEEKDLRKKHTKAINSYFPKVVQEVQPAQPAK